jgi:hypothetical protein
MLLLQHPVLVLVFKQYLCCSFAKWLNQETALWTTICPISGSSSAIFKQQLICHLLSAVYYCRLCSLKFTWRAAHCSSSLLQREGGVRRDTCLPATIAGFVTKSSRGEQLLASPPSLVHSEHTTPSAACPFQFLVYYYFFVGRGSVFPGGYAGLSQGWLWEHHVLLICSPVGLCLLKRFAVSGGTGALLTSQCNMV